MSIDYLASRHPREHILLHCSSFRCQPILLPNIMMGAVEDERGTHDEQQAGLHKTPGTRRSVGRPCEVHETENGHRERAVVRIQLDAGKATPAPPVGPALGQHAINIMQFCKEYNEKTATQSGSIVPAEVIKMSEHV